MEKRHDGLLGSGQWYFVDINQKEDKMDRFILDEAEYQIFFKGLDADGKFIKVGKNHYFWSKIDCFGPLEFEDGVLSKIREQTPEMQELLKKAIKNGINLRTMDKLRNQISLFLENS